MRRKPRRTWHEWGVKAGSMGIEPACHIPRSGRGAARELRWRDHDVGATEAVRPEWICVVNRGNYCLGASVDVTDEGEKEERLKAIHALRYARMRREGLVDWQFDISRVERKELISWAHRQIQKYFVRC
jgi:hypothetical protein